MRIVTATRTATSGSITIDGEDFAGFSIGPGEHLSVVATEVLYDHDIIVGIWTVDGDKITAQI